MSANPLDGNENMYDGYGCMYDSDGNLFFSRGNDIIPENIAWMALVKKRFSYTAVRWRWKTTDSSGNKQIPSYSYQEAVRMGPVLPNLGKSLPL
ncbi:MAG TPA: hypothetical protein VNZ86_17365 [Bacteroidia bacterium]|nr:hypothetical protein [Bacteroidia bacterium]